LFNESEEHYTPITVESNEAIQNMAVILNTGNATIDNLSVTKSLSSPSGLSIGGNSISPGSASPNALNFNYGDGTGWKANFGNPNSPLTSINDQGHVTATQLVITDPANTNTKNYTILNNADGYLAFNSQQNGGSIKMGNGGDLYTSYLYSGTDANIAGTVKTTNIIANGNISAYNANITNTVTVSGNGGGYIFYDRTDPNNLYEWYSTGGSALLYNSTGTNILSIDKLGNMQAKSLLSNSDISAGGNLNIKGNMTATNLNIGAGPWQPDYFRFVNWCDQSTVYYASDANTLAVGPSESNTGDNAIWYWIGNRLYNKQYGTCLQEDGNGNYSLGKYNYSNKYQMISKIPLTDTRYFLTNLGAKQRLGGPGKITWYAGTNGSDCNYYFLDIV